MVFAGPVFTEWYWGPILFAFVYGPPLSALAVVADVGVRRWVAPLRGWRRAGLWAGVAAAGALGVLAGAAFAASSASRGRRPAPSTSRR